MCHLNPRQNPLNPPATRRRDPHPHSHCHPRPDPRIHRACSRQQCATISPPSFFLPSRSGRAAHRAAREILALFHILRKLWTLLHAWVTRVGVCVFVCVRVCVWVGWGGGGTWLQGIWSPDDCAVHATHVQVAALCFRTSVHVVSTAMADRVVAIVVEQHVVKCGTCAKRIVDARHVPTHEWESQHSEALFHGAKCAF